MPEGDAKLCQKRRISLAVNHAPDAIPKAKKSLLGRSAMTPGPELPSTNSMLLIHLVWFCRSPLLIVAARAMSRTHQFDHCVGMAASNGTTGRNPLKHLSKRISQLA